MSEKRETYVKALILVSLVHTHSTAFYHTKTKDGSFNTVEDKQNKFSSEEKNEFSRSVQQRCHELRSRGLPHCRRRRLRPRAVERRGHRSFVRRIRSLARQNRSMDD